MARIRSIKPEFWDDRKLARRTSRDARLLYIALWNMADEHARLNGDPRWVRGQAFPYEDDLDDALVAGMLGELQDATVVVAYEADGDPYLYLPKLARHQRLEPGKVASKIPQPPQPAEQPGQVRANSSAPRADSSEPGDDPSALLYVAGSMEHGAWSRGAARGPDRAEPEPRPPRPPDASGLHEIPDDFAMNGAMRRWANAEYPGLDLDQETVQFCRHWRAEGKRKKNWTEAWRKWIGDSHKRMTQQTARASPPRGRQQETDELFDAAMQRARAREEAGDDPHRNGNALPTGQGALPAASDRLLHPRRVARGNRAPRPRRVQAGRRQRGQAKAVHRTGRDHCGDRRRAQRSQAALECVP